MADVLRCPDPECWTTYAVYEDDQDTAFELMVNHYRFNMRHCDGKSFEAAAAAVSDSAARRATTHRPENRMSTKAKDQMDKNDGLLLLARIDALQAPASRLPDAGPTDRGAIQTARAHQAIRGPDQGCPGRCWRGAGMSITPGDSRSTGQDAPTDQRIRQLSGLRRAMYHAALSRKMSPAKAYRLACDRCCAAPPGEHTKACTDSWDY